MSRFESRISVRKDRDKVDHWTVYLPHKCEDWDIAGAMDDWGDIESVPFEEAEKRLKNFAAELIAALMCLQSRKEIHNGDWPT